MFISLIFCDYYLLTNKLNCISLYVITYKIKIIKFEKYFFDIWIPYLS